jgi:hypothetical protein
MLMVLVWLVSLPAAAAAKGPHASLSARGAAPEPGKPWTAQLRLFEFQTDQASSPVVIARRGDERVSFDVHELSHYVPRRPDVLTEMRYRLRGVIPSAGRWLITVTTSGPSAGPFRFEPVQVGGAGAPVRNLLAISGAPPARGTPLPPEVFSPPAARSGNEQEPGRLWIPAAAAALAAAGGAAVLRRRRTPAR